MKRLLAALLPLALLCASAASAATLQADPSSLRRVYDAAAAGDVIQLATGAYGDVSFATYPQSKVFAAPGVVIMPAPGAKPVFSSVNLSNGAAGVTLQDIEIALTADVTGVAIAQGDAPKPGGAIHLKRLKIHGPDVAGNAYTGQGIFVRSDGPDISIEDSEIYNVGNGASIMDSTGVALTGSHIHHVQIDGVDIAGSSNVTIDNNDFDHFYAGTGDHPDAIQSWATAAHPRNVGLTITHNRIVASSPTFPPQGIFLANADNVVIRGDAMVGTLWNGISLSDVKTAMVESNFVQSAPWGGDPSTGTRIIVRGQSADVTVQNNMASAWGQYLDGGQPNPNYVEAGNVKVPATTRNAAGEPDTTDFLKWVAAQGQASTPVPAPTPAPTPAPIPAPALNPLQATVDALNAQVASLTAQVADLTAKLAAAQSATTAAQGQVSTLTAQLAAVQSQLTTCQAQLKAATTKITKGRAALK